MGIGGIQILTAFRPRTGEECRAKNREIKWGCTNRISNGRAVCDSHHVNDDVLQRTYLAAIREMIEDADDIMAAVKDSA